MMMHVYDILFYIVHFPDVLIWYYLRMQVVGVSEDNPMRKYKGVAFFSPF